MGMLFPARPIQQFVMMLRSEKHNDGGIIVMDHLVGFAAPVKFPPFLGLVLPVIEKGHTSY